MTKPVAWIRYCSDDTYEGPILDGRMEEVRKQSGAWTPLYEAPAAPALVPPQSTQAVLMGLAACDAGGFVATTNAVLAVWRACEKFHGIKP